MSWLTSLRRWRASLAARSYVKRTWMSILATSTRNAMRHWRLGVGSDGFVKGRGVNPELEVHKMIREFVESAASQTRSWDRIKQEVKENYRMRIPEEKIRAEITNIRARLDRLDAMHGQGPAASTPHTTAWGDVERSLNNLSRDIEHIGKNCQGGFRPGRRVVEVPAGQEQVEMPFDTKKGDVLLLHLPYDDLDREIRLGKARQVTIRNQADRIEELAREKNKLQVEKDNAQGNRWLVQSRLDNIRVTCDRYPVGPFDDKDYLISALNSIKQVVG